MKILIAKQLEAPEMVKFPCFMEDENETVYFVLGSIGGGSKRLEGFPIIKRSDAEYLHYGEFTSNLNRDTVHVFKGIITIEQ